MVENSANLWCPTSAPLFCPPKLKGSWDVVHWNIVWELRIVNLNPYRKGNEMVALRSFAILRPKHKKSADEKKGNLVVPYYES